jgi:formylglycine-generating enzyme required for sulfatase activity
MKKSKITKRLFVSLFLIFYVGCNEQQLTNTKPEIQLGPRNPDTSEKARILQEQTAKDMNLPKQLSIKISDANANNVFMDFMLIPAGSFHMGSPETELKRNIDESPLHQVVISKPFYMSKFEVTQRQYRAVLGNYKAFYFVGFDFPADGVSWNVANEFTNKLSDETGMRFRLPTEAEWEYACRAGTDTPFYTGETLSPYQANYDSSNVYGKGLKGKALIRPTKVGSYPPNPFGLYDMYGNVWEWCSDRYSKKSYESSSLQDPLGIGTSLSTVIRGGGWESPPGDCRSASRDYRKSWRSIDFIGFRLVIEIDDISKFKKF